MTTRLGIGLVGHIARNRTRLTGFLHNFRVFQQQGQAYVTESVECGDQLRMLENNYEKLRDGRNGLKMFVPLCGKSLDLKWLYDKGHTIVGVECSEMACLEFFQEQGLKYVQDSSPISGSVFRTTDNRLKIYCTDLYEFNVSLEGKFDGIYDRGSLVAINKADRKKYVSLVQSLLHSTSTYLLVSSRYDGSKYAGPPHDVQEEDVQSLYGGQFNIEHLCTVNTTAEKHRKWGLEEFLEVAHFLTLKA